MNRLANKDQKTSFVYNNFKVLHQRNGDHYLITPLICMYKRNIFLLNCTELNNLKNGSIKSVCIFKNNYINVFIKTAKGGKAHKYFGKDKYVIIYEELKESNDFIIDDGFESDGTEINSHDSCDNDDEYN